MRTTAITVEPMVLSRLIGHFIPNPDDTDIKPWWPRGGEPHPIPWRQASEAVTLLVADLRSQQGLIRAVVAEKEQARAFAGIESYVSDVIEGWCKTGYRPFPIPRPHGLEQVVLGALLQDAITNLSNPQLQGPLQAGVSKLFATGLEALAKER